MKNILLIVTLLFAVSAQAGDTLDITDLTEKTTFGQQAVSGKRNIDIVVIHSTYYVGADSFSIDGVLKQFRRYDVSAHYIIGRNGEIYRAVAENNIAHHAGKSRLPNSDRSNINSTSIGIEIINTPATPPTQAQYSALVRLVRDIRRRHPIAYLVRHSDIAPDRKADPWAFDWEYFLSQVK